MHVLGFILIISGLLTVTYFSGPKSSIEKSNPTSQPQDQVQAMPTNPPTQPNFDYEGAKAAGYSDAEIQAYLASKSQQDNKITPKPQPTRASDKALRLSAYIFSASNENQKSELINKFSDGNNDLKLAVTNLALMLDSKPDALTIADKLVAEDLSKKKILADNNTELEYHQKEFEKLQAEYDRLNTGLTNNPFAGSTQNTNRLSGGISDSLINQSKRNSLLEQEYSQPFIPIQNAPKQAVRYDVIGDSVYGSDGSRYDRIGDSIYKNDGTRYDIIGDSVYGNNGSRYDQIGNSIYQNDGTRYDAIGGSVYGSDGSRYDNIGDSIYFNPGY